MDDPAGYLRDALAAHERSERARRTLHRDAPGILISSASGPWTTEDGWPLTEEWWEQHSDPGADPFVLSLIASMRDLLDDYDQDAALLKSLDPAGEAYGMTVKRQAARMATIRQWAAAYAARQKG
ncbi:hypothetical protein ACWEQC_22105 [Streptomyces shenzhenensis]